jgi:hypothetical protein
MLAIFVNSNKIGIPSKFFFYLIYRVLFQSIRETFSRILDSVM